MQRLAIATAYEAMESAGFVINRTPSTQANRIGTFYGQTSDDWREINAAENIDTYFITGGVRAFGPVSDEIGTNYPQTHSNHMSLGSHQLSLWVQRT